MASDGYKQRSAQASFCEMVFEVMAQECGLLTERYDALIRNAFEAKAGPQGRRMLSDDAHKDNPTVRKVRYAPDFRLQLPLPDGRLPLIEAKFMSAPRFLPHARRFDGVEVEVGRVGDIEKHSLESYLEDHTNDKRRTALFVICTYHERPVLLEFVDRIRVLATGDGQRNAKAAGSGTSHSNIDLASMRTVDEFFRRELDIELVGNESWRKLQGLIGMALHQVQAPEKYRESHGATIEAVTREIATKVGRPMHIIWQPSVVRHRAQGGPER